MIAVSDVRTKPVVSLQVQWPNGQHTEVDLQRDDNPLGDPFYVLHPQAQPVALLHDRITLQEWGGTTTGAILDGRYYMTADNPDYALHTARAMILLAALVSVVGVGGIFIVVRRRWRVRRQSGST